MRGQANGRASSASLPEDVLPLGSESSSRRHSWPTRRMRRNRGNVAKLWSSAWRIPSQSWRSAPRIRPKCPNCGEATAKLGRSRQRIASPRIWWVNVERNVVTFELKHTKADLHRPTFVRGQIGPTSGNLGWLQSMLTRCGTRDRRTTLLHPNANSRSLSLSRASGAPKGGANVQRHPSDHADGVYAKRCCGITWANRPILSETINGFHRNVDVGEQARVLEVYVDGAGIRAPGRRGAD